jgi:hypothetical protein
MAERADGRRKKAVAAETGKPAYRTAKETRAYLASQNLRFSLRKVYALIASGDLPHVQIGGRLYVPNLESWLTQRVEDDTAAARAARQRAEAAVMVGGDHKPDSADDPSRRGPRPASVLRTPAWATAMIAMRQLQSSTNDSYDAMRG